MSDGEKTKVEVSGDTDKSWLDKWTGRTGKVTAFLLALTALIAVIPQLSSGVKAAYCSIVSCSSKTLDAPSIRSDSTLPSPKNLPNKPARENNSTADQFTQSPSKPAVITSSAPPQSALNDPPNDGINYFVGSLCSGSTWTVQSKGWAITNFKKLHDPRIISLLIINPSPISKLYFAISLPTESKLDQPILITRTFYTWDQARWPDGTKTGGCKSAYGYRLDLPVDGKLIAGKYWGVYRIDNSASVGISDIEVE